MWLGTDLVFDAFKFYIVETPHGVMQIHGYPYDATGSTFIVEMNDAVWRRAGFEGVRRRDFAAGGERRRSPIAEIRALFGDILDGHEVQANNSRWISFTTVRNEPWHHGNVVLLGDAAHTAHFSIGSGTKLAMEDALALAACLHEQPDVAAALEAYEAERKPVVLSTQRAAQASLEWFENLGQYVDQEPLQFAFNILTRSRRVTYDNLRLRDPEFVGAVDAWFAEHEHRRGHGSGDVRAADVPAVPAARARAEQPRRRLADGHVLGDRRHAERLPPRAPRQQGAGRRRPGDDRDGLRLARRADHAGLRRHVRPGARGRMAAHRRLRARTHAGEDRPPARPLRPQGLDQADVGGHRRAAPRATGRSSGPSPIPYSAINQVPHQLTARRDGGDPPAVRLVGTCR